MQQLYFPYNTHKFQHAYVTYWMTNVDLWYNYVRFHIILNGCIANKIILYWH